MFNNIDETKIIIKKFIGELAIENYDKLKCDTNLFEEGILDSLGVVSLINLIESYFKIEIDDSDFEMEHFQSVSKLAEFLHASYI